MASISLKPRNSYIDCWTWSSGLPLLIHRTFRHVAEEITAECVEQGLAFETSQSMQYDYQRFS